VTEQVRKEEVLEQVEGEVEVVVWEEEEWV
jgi:hypothetical protein